MRYALAILPALALLLGCTNADGQLAEGSWKTTMTMTKFDIPGAPPAVAKQMQSMLGKSQSTEACMNASQARAGIRDFSSSMQQGDCKMEDFVHGAGKMKGKMACSSSAMGATSMQMNGEYTREKVMMTLAGEIKDAKLPGGKANLEMTITSERSGDCKS